MDRQPTNCALTFVFSLFPCSMFGVVYDSVTLMSVSTGVGLDISLPIHTVYMHFVYVLLMDVNASVH